MASPYKALQCCVKNNSETVGHIDLRLGQIVYISVFCDISSTGWFPVYFFVLCLLRDSENHLQGLVRTFFMVDIEWTNFKKVMSHSLNFSMEMSRMHQHLENWNDMKHELRRFCLADFFFFWFMLNCFHAQLVTVNHRRPFSQFSWGEGGLYTGY